MSRKRAANARDRAFVRKPFSPFRILWFSKIWLPLVLLMLGYFLTFHAAGTPAYATVILFGGGAIILVLLWRDTRSMWRAARSGEVRQARVSHFSNSRWHSDGLPLTRMHWSDAHGKAGQTPASRRDRFPATGTTIIVYVDPTTGQTWWEDRL